jgi:hypothetical protein
MHDKTRYSKQEEVFDTSSDYFIHLGNILRNRRQLGFSHPLKESSRPACASFGHQKALDLADAGLGSAAGYE